MYLRTTLLALVASAISLPGATLLMPDFAGIPAGWQVDRYDPHSFANIGVFQGRDNVLGIEITSAEGYLFRPAAFQSTFYNTQGRGASISGGADSLISADLYIPFNWSNSLIGTVPTDMWGVLSGGGSVTDFPLIGFTNYGGTPRYRIWDGNVAGGWVDLPIPVTYDAWTSFALEFTGSAYLYRINGATVYTDNTINGSTAFSGVNMEAYNFYDPALAGATPVDYTAYWDNTVVPEPATRGALVSSAAILLLVFRRRRIRVAK